MFCRLRHLRPPGCSLHKAELNQMLAELLLSSVVLRLHFLDGSSQPNAGWLRLVFLTVVALVIL